MNLEELEFFAHYLRDKIIESKKKHKIRLSPEECKSYESLTASELKFYESLAYTIVSDFKLEPDKYLRF